MNTTPNGSNNNNGELGSAPSEERGEIMKSSAKLFVVALVVTAASAFVPSSAFAQASATAGANASANIIAPITLLKLTDLVFGDIVPNTTVGTVTMDTTGTVTVGGGVTALASTRSAATFTVGGQNGRAYTVSSIGNITISNILGPDMIINPSSDCGGGAAPCRVNVLGVTTVRVGGTLNVKANQPAALYTGTFSVTVTYN